MISKELATLLAGEPQEVVPGSIVVSGSGVVATQGSVVGEEGSIVAGGDVRISTSSLPKDDDIPSIPSGVGTEPPATEAPEALAATIADAVINDRPAGYFIWTSSSHLAPGST